MQYFHLCAVIYVSQQVSRALLVASACNSRIW